MKQTIVVLATIVLLPVITGRSGVLRAQSAFDKFKQQQQADFDKFKKDSQDEYDAFRKKLNDEYAEFMRQTWEAFPTHPADKPKEEKDIKPQVYEEPAPAPQPTPQPKTEPQPAPTPQPEPEPIEIAVDPTIVVVPEPTPAPKPIAPVKPKEDIPSKRVTVSYYGTLVSVSFPTEDKLKLKALTENDIADAWNILSDKKYDITVKTALDARKANDLCDWAYMSLLQAVTEKQYGKTNEAVLMQAFLMTQSGYRIRLAMASGKLYMLIASMYEIYHMSYIQLDGQKFYIIGDKDNTQYQICESKFDKEQSLSLQMARLPKLGEDPTPKRTLTSRKGVTASVSVNKNLIDFFDSYPSACINGDFGTRWAAYANTPLDKNVRDALYPVLKRTVANLSEKDAVGLILNWVQTAFKYGYDNEIWGGDRAFFAQETLYYPYSDCEDRAILFSRLVRDILGLKVVLLYYPGHLASAVAFNDDVKGDWLMYNNRRYTVCDPTYVNAPVGATMPGMDNAKAKVIVLK